MLIVVSDTKTIDVEKYFLECNKSKSIRISLFFLSILDVFYTLCTSGFLISLGWSIVYIEESLIVFLSLKIVFVLINNVDPGEKQHPVAFHLSQHRLPKEPL